MIQLADLSPPAPIAPEHDLSTFNSGIPSLDEWLVKRAMKNERSSASRTYVVCADNKVLAYYCLSAGAIAQSGVPKKMKRNMPDPIPVLVVGRLAIDLHWQNKGLGKALLQDAIRRALQAGEIAGVTALLVHALSDEAKRFYLSRGFVESPVQPMTLMMRLDDAGAVIGGRS